MLNACLAGRGLGAALIAFLLMPIAPAWSAETVTYYYTNEQGTPLATTDAAGVILTVVDYRSFGSQALGTPQQGPGYTGHINDTDSGLVYMQQRYYDPVTGRFVSVDPVAVRQIGDNFNRYWYANNNPYRFKDPDGRECDSADNKTICTPGKKGDGLPTISFPTPKTFPTKISNDSLSHHEYRYDTNYGGKSDKSVQQAIANDPTPGKDMPATPTGTANNASPTSGARQVFSSIADSPVKSYTATDSKGNIWTINVTEPGHPLFPGYTLRGAVNGTAVTYGEGSGMLQAFGPASQLIINDVWKSQNQTNIDNAK